METISQLSAALIGIALISSIFEAVLKDSTMKQALRVITMTALAVLLLSQVRDLDFKSYAAAVVRDSAFQPWDGETARDRNQLLDRKLIESECAAYIEAKAAEIGVPVLSVQVTLCWNTDGYWIPERAQLTVGSMTPACSQLQDVISAELGIAPDAQEWSIADET